MANRHHFAEGVKLLPLLAPVDIAATATASAYIDTAEAHWATFDVSFGVITGDTATLTLEASTAGSSNATEAGIPFSYRLTSAVNTDTLGAITAATSDGVTVTATDDNKVFRVELDLDALPATGEDYQWLRVVVSPASDMTVCLVGVNALMQPRYPGNSIASAT